ncbi:hypothetical protein [Aurantimonas endophytica]|uniref:Uncharacterized protein n=1 Tax=Aurantimonas endophytica TaxID=1522175 RepID=A0A7W6HG65_9HYPH|nr:hypothetical protein [Aurantimonas endophytica]MBB4004441.1 hypothetical protein [Aurantimonas endophytica]MCO6405278.1 hypothetical protein [Aurantimonas endophytica]
MGRIMFHLAVAEQARLTLMGKRKGAGFWQMPQGRPFVVACYRQNIDMARRARLARAA